MYDDPSTEEPTKWREVKYCHSPNFPDILGQLGVSLLVSTYQAGKLVVIGVADNQLQFSFHNFDQAMGVAVGSRRMAVGAKGQIWFLHSSPEIAVQMVPPGRYQACYLARSAVVTGNIHCHEMAWSGDELWVVNTLFSCLSTLHPEYSFIPRWRPPFITDLEGNDRCHLNGLAMHQGQPRFVSMMAESNLPAGWRETKNSSGCVMDIASGAVVTRGLAMPHSPRFHDGRLWVLNSGMGAIELVDLQSGYRDTVTKVPGYTRGLAFAGPCAFVGLSRIRETAIFGGVPVAERLDELKCGVGIVDWRSGQQLASLQFESGVEEIFDVQVVPQAACTAVCGPRPDQDVATDVWVVPRPDAVEHLVRSEKQGRASVAPALAVPEDAASLVRRALTLQRERRSGEALEVFARAAALEPNNGEIQNHLGNALQDVGQQDQALECYRRAVQVAPSFAPAQQNLGYLLINRGECDRGREHLREAQRISPANVNRVMLATTLPIIYESIDDVRRRRKALVQDVNQLVQEGVRVDAAGSLIPTNFFAVYQGANDRDLQRDLGRIYHGIDACRGRGQDRAKGNRRPKVGFISAYFRDHTIGRLNLGRIQHLDKSKLDVTVIVAGRHRDDLAEGFRQSAEHYVEVPREPASAIRIIADLGLDLLFFADVGMDALTFSLVYSRMAPVQCATWGHPVTTGSPMMDYFVSSELLETADGDSHYTEKLVRLPSLATYYFRPRLSSLLKVRADFGLPDDRHLYLCPQTLFKFHPEFDRILAEILRQDTEGDLVLLEGRVPKWTSLLQERFEREIPDMASRIRFLPAQNNADFLQLLTLADVMLDPIHFGGGNTSYEAFAMGVPIVTLPGPFLRSRITAALYKKMDCLELVVKDPQEYVAQSVRLATDESFRLRQRRAIADRAEVLFEDIREVRDLEQFLLTATEGVA